MTETNEVSAARDVAPASVLRVLDATAQWPQRLQALLRELKPGQILSVTVIEPDYARKRTALQSDPMFKHWTWPSALPGLHSIALSEKALTLTLAVMPLEKAMEQLSGQFDRLYFDGSWQEHLPRASSLAKLSATGAVLFGKGQFETQRAFLQRAAYVLLEQGPDAWQAQMRARHTRGHTREASLAREVIVIGAGLSGANVAWTLTQLGFKVRVIDQGVVAGAAASALACGILHPHFSRDDNVLSRFSREGFLLTCARLNLLQAQLAQPLYYPYGCLQMAHSDAIWQEWRTAKQLHEPFEMPETYACLINQAQACEKTGVALKRGGWWFNGGGLVRVGAYCRALIDQARVPYWGNTSVKALRRQGNLWQLIGEAGQVLDQAPQVVVAAAYESVTILQSEHLSMQPLKGRITLMRDTDLSGLKAPVSGEGYITRLPSEGFVGVGATYELTLTPEDEAHEKNLAKLSDIMLEHDPVVVTGAYCGTRAVGHARLPYVGAVVDEAAWLEQCQRNGKKVALELAPSLPGLWVCAGMGSRGVSFSALASQILAAHMLDLPMPADATLVKALLPGRVMVHKMHELQPISQQ